MPKLIITIDGPAASGKSTAARLLARKLNAKFLDTGAMYRTVTLAAMEQNIELTDEQKLLEVLDNREFQFEAGDGKTISLINGIDVTGKIRNPKVTANARHIASAAKVREKLVQMQRQLAHKYKKVVTEGRDQGTIAFPDANVKFYLDADITKRAERRLAELQAAGENLSLDQVIQAIKARDESDLDRATGPLKPAEDAVIIDTSDLTVQQVVEKLFGCIGKNKANKNKMIWFRFARFFCKVFCRIFFKFDIYGIENIPCKGAFLLISNHQSFFDPVFCGIFVDRVLYFLARDTLFKNFFFSRLLTSINTIPVRRGQADISAVKKIITKLKKGDGVCLFPEGTRTRDGKIAELKPGFGLLSRRGNAAIVPMVIDGAFECWPRHKKIFKIGAKITICYGQAITTDKIKQTDDREIAKLLTDILRTMQNDCRIKQGKKPFDY